MSSSLSKFTSFQKDKIKDDKYIFKSFNSRNNEEAALANLTTALATWL